MTDDAGAERLFEYTSPAYRPAGYTRMTPDECSAWGSAHAALRTADGRARDAEVRVDRARARSRRSNGQRTSVYMRRAPTASLTTFSRTGRSMGLPSCVRSTRSQTGG